MRRPPPFGVDRDLWLLPSQPDPAAVRKLIRDYMCAAEARGSIVRLPIETVAAAKAFAGWWRENTICFGMGVAWIAGFEPGDWSAESYLYGEVIGIDRGYAAVGGVGTNRRGGSSSSPDTPIAVVRIQDLRVKPADWD
jgi:hypothetical protein